MALQAAGSLLIAGNKPAPDKLVTVKLLRGYRESGEKVHAPGAVVTVPRLVAIDLIQARKAEWYTAPPPPAPTPEAVQTPAPTVQEQHDDTKTDKPVSLSGTASLMRHKKGRERGDEHV